MVAGKQKKSKSDKLYRGAYNYMKNGNVYAEETFETYRDRKEMGMHFISQMHSRVATGELLSITTDYLVNKDFIPSRVIIDRSLGNTHVQESYFYDNRKNRLTYIFYSEKEREEVILSPPPRFHITAPTVSTSMLYLRSKKFDPNGKNYFQLYKSPNQWEFVGGPVQQSIYLNKISQTNESSSIDGQTVTGVRYYLYEDLPEEEIELFEGSTPYINIFISQYSTIPYYIETADGTRIQVKYLNNLSGE